MSFYEQINIQTTGVFEKEKMTNEWDDLLHRIKDLDLQFQITKNDLLHPSSSLVVKFYTAFIMEFQENVQLIAGPYYTSVEFNDHLEIEDRLFQTMHFIFSTENLMKFMLSDIYQPAPIRTKNVLKICCHLLSFMESLVEEGEKLGSNLFKMKADLNEFEAEHEKILSEINEKATKKSELLETKEKLLVELCETRKIHEEMKDFMEQKEIVYLKKKKDIELLKQQMLQEEQELERMENTEKELSEQSTSEDEYNNLLNIVENLKHQYKLFDSEKDNMEYMLDHENNDLLHFQDCRKRVPDTEDFDLEVVKSVIELGEDLKDLQLENEKIINDNRNPLKLVRTQNKKKVLQIKQHIEQLSNNFHDLLNNKMKDEEECTNKINKMKGEIKGDSRYITGVIKTLVQEISQLETDLNDIKKTFYSEYVKIAEADAAVKGYFKKVLRRIKNTHTV